LESSVGLQLTNEELTQLEQPHLLATSGRDVVEKSMRNYQNLQAKIEGRLQYLWTLRPRRTGSGCQRTRLRYDKEASA